MAILSRVSQKALWLRLTCISSMISSSPGPEVPGKLWQAPLCAANILKAVV